MDVCQMDRLITAALHAQFCDPPPLPKITALSIYLSI